MNEHSIARDNFLCKLVFTCNAEILNESSGYAWLFWRLKAFVMSLQNKLLDTISS